MGGMFTVYEVITSVGWGSKKGPVDSTVDCGFQATLKKFQRRRRGENAQKIISYL